MAATLNLSSLPTGIYTVSIATQAPPPNAWQRNKRKDLSCKKLTTTLIEAFSRESLDGQKIKEIAKANRFKYDHEHIYGKIAPYEIGRNIYFEQRGNIFLTNTSISKNNFDYKDIFNAEYKEGVGYFSIKNLKIEKVTLQNDPKIDRYFTCILFVILDIGQVAIDYENRSVILITSDHWDIKNRDKSVPWVNPDDGFLFRRGVKVLSPR